MSRIRCIQIRIIEQDKILFLVSWLKHIYSKTCLTLTLIHSLDKSKALSLVLHCCDISHPSKNWVLHERWTTQLLEEFFRQGDKERELGLPYSPLCDRNNTLVAESQIGEWFFPSIL